MSERLVKAVSELLGFAEPIVNGRAPGRLAAARARLHGPLRVAIAGKVKAGKSTLLNALVGEQIAPTDASECTRVVTWYRNGQGYRVTAVPHMGESSSLRFQRTDDELTIDLGRWRADDLQYLDVEWPSGKLRDLVLIDTPGLASVSGDVSARTERFLSADEQGPGDADAVLYLLRHVHHTDLSFLEAFKGSIATAGATVNSIGVISRADEIGSCRVNAMSVAAQVAARHRRDSRLSALCQEVVPIAGLIAQAASTMREEEAEVLRQIAAGDADRTAEQLLSAERFCTLELGSGPDTETRHRLLDRFGLFGVRVAIELITARGVVSTADLSAELARRSGIDELRRLLLNQFAARGVVLKARSALATVDALAGLLPDRDARRLHERVRDIERDAHELVEIRLLRQARITEVTLADDHQHRGRRALGELGPEPSERLGLAPSATRRDVRTAALEAVGQWRVLAEDPMNSPFTRELALGVVRSCEEMAAAAAR